jgi:hypothetical protein
MPIPVKVTHGVCWKRKEGLLWKPRDPPLQFQMILFSLGKYKLIFA